MGETQHQNQNQDHLVEKAIIITPHDAVNDIRNVKADTYSESDYESPNNSSDEIAASEDYIGSTKGKNVASEAVRRKRRKCLMVLSFFPLLAASVALVGFVLKGQNNNDTAGSTPEDGEAAASTTDEVKAVDSPTLSPSGLRALPTTPGPVLTNEPTVGGPKDKLSTLSPTHSNDFATTKDDSGVTDVLHGNLRSTTSPSLSPTNKSPTVGPILLSKSPTDGPTSGPSSSDDISIGLVSLLDLGNDGFPQAVFPLDACQGDCDSDSDCKDSLICYPRDNLEGVPGCSGEGSLGTDYCIARPSNLLTISKTKPFELCSGSCDSDNDCAEDLICYNWQSSSDMRADEVPGCEGRIYDGASYCIRRPINYLITTNEFPLGLCSGDCDFDEDCAGFMTCEQRDGLEEISGCIGFGSEGTDYCTLHPTNWLSTSKSYPLGLCKGDCDADEDCEDGLVCEQRIGFDEIPGCEGRGSEDSDYCRLPEATLDVVTITAATTTMQSSTCFTSGKACTDKKDCCNGKCEKDPTTGEKVCLDPEVPNDNQLLETCLDYRQPCIDKKKCCSGWCQKNEVTKEEMCGWTTPPDNLPPAEDTCFAYGEACIDKKKCCSGWCEKDPDTKQEICGRLETEDAKPAEAKPEEDTCLIYGEACTDKKKCCAGWCEKDPVTKEEICGWLTPPLEQNEMQPACHVSGEPCVDKKKCCSGLCTKKEISVDRVKEDGSEDKAEKVKVEVCG